MDQQKLTKLLHLQNTELAERTPFCPDDHEIAAYVDGKPDHPESELYERHLVSCGYCLARAAVLARLHENGEAMEIPEALFATAEQFGQQPGRRLRYAPAWAAAAVVIISLFTIVARQPNLSVDPGDALSSANPAGEDVRQLRNIDRVSPAPTVLSPDDGASIRSDQLTVRWTRVPGSLYYDIRIVDAEGFMIWQDRVEETQSSLPDHLGLISGDQYFVRVDAYLAEAKSIGSRHVKFTIEQDN